MIEEDTIAIGSEKVKNAIVKVNMTSELVEWIVGGPNGTYALIDQDGTHWEAGHSLWSGQHNAEYFGENEYLMFDDQTHWVQTKFYDSETKIANTSRLLIVEVNETTETAEITWDYPLGYHTNHYGDMDMLPTGNILGAAWVTQDLPGDNHPGFEAQVLEVVRDTKEVAWEVLVVGNRTETLKESDEMVRMRSWSVYSAERMYATPLVYDLQCRESGDKNASLRVEFTTQNRFKQSNRYPGSYTVLGTKNGAADTILTNGTFDFNPFFRPTQVDFSFHHESESICQNITLVVTNQWGDETSKNF